MSEGTDRWGKECSRDFESVNTEHDRISIINKKLVLNFLVSGEINRKFSFERNSSNELVQVYIFIHISNYIANGVETHLKFITLNVECSIVFSIRIHIHTLPNERPFQPHPLDD